VDRKTARVNVLVQAEPNALFKADAVVLAAIVEERPVKEIAVIPDEA
jgi:hypothetical protein